MVFNVIMNVPLVIELFRRHHKSIKNNCERVMRGVDQSVILNRDHLRANPIFAASFNAASPCRPVKSRGQALVAENMASFNQR